MMVVVKMGKQSSLTPQGDTLPDPPVEEGTSTISALVAPLLFCLQPSFSLPKPDQMYAQR